MTTRQYNLKLPDNLARTAQDYADRYGYRNIQDLAIDTLRERLYQDNRYDETLSEEEIHLIDALATASITADDPVSEDELRATLRR